jgi:carboxypeptidase T
VHLFTLGDSYQGRNLIGARVSNDANDNLSEPGVFFVGQHHAREHLTVEVVLALLHTFADSAKPDVTTLVNSRQIYIVPSLNPDGAE